MDFILRKKILEEMTKETLDLLVIGGGINGAGVAREAASRGMKVALVEARDFAFGTSSRSSKLIHGGIRYLENLEFGLVFEALSERRKLFQLAPHLVHPLRFVLPLYKGGRVGMLKMGLGMWLYDALALFETPEGHARLTPSETQQRIPVLQTQNLLGSYAYSDAYMDDDRLVHETLRSAERQGAWIVNYCRAGHTIIENGKVQALQLEDQLSHTQMIVKARHVVSTVGPWTDLVAPHLVHHWKPRLRPTMGVHLTFPRHRLPFSDAVVMAAEKRIVFAIPRHEMVIVGTTDTDYSADPADVHARPEDVDYLLHVTDRYFPHARLKKTDILASYAGVRPLVHDDSETESKTSREHLILHDDSHVTFVMGGKYTTYRLIAEQTVQSILNFFPLEDQVRWSQSQTLEPLNPLVTQDILNDKENWIHHLAQHYRLSLHMVQFLFNRHGAEAETILKKYFPCIEKGLPYDHQMWALETYQAIHETMCSNLVDFYSRRSPLFLSYAGHGLEYRNTIGQVFKSRLSLTDADLKIQHQELDRYINSELLWKQQNCTS